MSATNQTTNLHLPLFVGSDKPAWLVDFNGAMNSIDTAVGTNTTDISGLDAQVTAMSGTVETLNTTVTGHTASIIALNTATSHNAGDISTINSLIGNGTPTTSDKTLIGAINELDAKDGNLSDLVTTAKSSLVAAINEAAQGSGAAPAASSVSYNNSTSHLSANNVQAAIDELAQGGSSEYYSTTETKIGKWINNEDLYQKVIDLGTLPNATSKEVSHNISNLAYMVSVSGIANTSEHTAIPLPRSGSATQSTVAVDIYADSTKVHVETGIDLSTFSGYAILKYTKTA